MRGGTSNIDTNLTHGTMPLPAWLPRIKFRSKWGKTTSWHMWQKRVKCDKVTMKEIVCSILSNTLFHTFPQRTYFYPSLPQCHLCQHVVFVFRTLLHVQPVVMQVSSWHFVSVLQLFKKDRHCHAKITETEQLFTSHHSFARLHTVFYVCYWKVYQEIFC